MSESVGGFLCLDEIISIRARYPLGLRERVEGLVLAGETRPVAVCPASTSWRTYLIGGIRV